MAVSQLSVFAENKPGGLRAMTQQLAEAGIDIRALSLADTQEYGVVRMIVSDIERARAILSEKNFLISVTPVAAVALPDEPGALARAIAILCEAELNVEYLYAFVAPGTYACAILRVMDVEKAEKLLSENGFELLSEEDVSRI